MNTRHIKKIILEGNYVAEVELDVLYTEEGWSPYITLEDAYKLDNVKEMLKQGDLKTAIKIAKVYTLTQVSA